MIIVLVEHALMNFNATHNEIILWIAMHAEKSGDAVHKRSQHASG